MTFKEIKPNYPVYALYRGDEPRVVQGKIINVSMPHVEPVMGINKTAQMVVDVTAEIDGKTSSYSIPESLSVTYAGTDLVLSTDREGIIREVEGMKAQSEEILASVDKHKKILDGCNVILTEWNPAYKEKRETEERFNKIETSIGRLSELVSGFIEEFKK